MALEMKELIADAAMKLLVKGSTKRLTVKDIVEECQITRQAFYYYFDSIPEMLEWALDSHADKLIDEIIEKGSIEEGIKHFLTVMLGIIPYVKKGLSSSYSAELDRLMNKGVYNLFARTIKRKGALTYYSSDELEFVIRYHSQATIGILKTWSEEDSENIDHIAHCIYKIVSGEINPNI